MPGRFIDAREADSLLMMAVSPSTAITTSAPAAAALALAIDSVISASVGGGGVFGSGDRVEQRRK